MHNYDWEVAMVCLPCAKEVMADASRKRDDLASKYATLKAKEDTFNG